MSLDRPKPVAAYFAADQSKDGDVAAYFTKDATVIDENRTYEGREAIRSWKTGTSHRYDYTSAPIAVDDQGQQVIVTSHLEGNFPGSPTDLRYIFEIDGDAIARLEITA